MSKITATLIVISLFSLTVCLSNEFLKEDTDSLTLEFTKFASVHQKNYQSFEEFRMRERIFRINLVKMTNMFQNIGESKGEIKYSPFMDLTEEEFAATHFGFNYDAKASESRVSSPAKFTVNLNQDVPASYDWREQGAVTPVKNQGSCGSCWAFSAVGNLEGQTKIVNGSLLSLSEQELVDCDTVDQGCNGGLMEQAFDALKTIGGIETEADYPYHGRGETCHFDSKKSLVKVEGYTKVSDDEEVIKETLFKTGPLAVALNATPLQFYFGGIFHPWKVACNPKGLNHGVLLVGYGEENGKKYWIVKNSWGKSWGEKGFFRMLRGTGECGINNHVLTAKLVD